MGWLIGLTFPYLAKSVYGASIELLKPAAPDKNEMPLYRGMPLTITCIQAIVCKAYAGSESWISSKRLTTSLAEGLALGSHSHMSFTTCTKTSTIKNQHVDHFRVCVCVFTVVSSFGGDIISSGTIKGR